MKLVGYCRVSTENQAKDGTIEIQRQAIAEWAAKNGHDIIAMFEDDGVSGAKDLVNRPGLRELLDYLDANKHIEGAVIYKADRLARDAMIQEMLVRREFKDKGRRVISVIEGEDFDSNDPTRKLLRQILGSFAEFEKDMIKLRMTSGRMKKAKDQGKGYAGGRAAIGYKAEGKDLKHDEDAVETVKTIYELRAQGFSLRAIVAELNAQQIPTASGGKWYAGTVKYILDNPVYKGTLHYKGIENNRPDLQIAA